MTRRCRPSSREASNAGRCTCTPCSGGSSNGPTADPARVSGGPGTGKTIVALHRVKWLVQRLPSGSSGKDVLFTTFNKNLAADLRQRLLLLGGPELLDRVDVVNIDRLATQVVNEAQPGARLHWMDDDKAIDLWREMLLELGETRWDAEFLHDEWSQVVLGHAITSRQEYFRARRAGRGRQLNRAQRAAIWELVEQFTKRLDEANLWTFRRVAAHAARLERAARGHPRAPVQAHRGGRGAGPELGALDAAASHGRPRGRTTCSSRATPTSGSTTTTCPWAASASRSGAVRHG